VSDDAPDLRLVIDYENGQPRPRHVANYIGITTASIQTLAQSRDAA
jgi:hypothetical protein